MMEKEWWLKDPNNHLILQFSDLFTEEEIDSIVKKGEGLERGISTVHSLEGNFDTKIIKDIRNSSNTFIPVEDNSRWIFSKISAIIIQVNADYYNYDLTKLESLQYAVYNEGGYYKDHLDLGLVPPAAYRKLSFSIQLSDDRDYTGGNLNIKLSDDPASASRKKGDIIFFPSFLLHEVTGVTSGVRRSLVGWVHGPRFR
jgi:PKHD-type hydroxylase